MASSPVKFRCYRCNQLLGVSGSKAGRVVSCPRCAAELVVPDPDEADPPSSSDLATIEDEAARPWEAASLLGGHEEGVGGLDTGVPLNFLDIRPEDIRVEPGAPEPPRAPPAPPPRRATVVMPAPAPRDVELEAALTVADDPETDARARPDPAPVAAVIPPIRLDAPSQAPRRVDPATVRPRDLVLPRSVVAAWSLFVLLALVCAFFAGLFAGHYVWRVH